MYSYVGKASLCLRKGVIKMNAKKMIVLPLAVMALVSCETNSSVGSYEMKWVTPTSTPALAFFDQGDNANWVSSSVPRNVVIPAFGTATYDAIVFDGVSGLNVIKSNGYDWKLADWISGGNFYVVSTKHTAKTDFAAGQTVTGFIKTGNAARTFLKLSKDKWNWDYEDSDLTFLGGVADVQAAMLSNADSSDYWIVADPIYTAVKGALAAKGVALNQISDLQADFKDAYDVETIPAAALFVRGATYESHKDAVDSFLSETQSRVDVSIDDPDKVIEALHAYGNDDKVFSRFGFTPSMVTTMQGDDANKFAMLKRGVITDDKAFANGFASVILGSTFDDSYFLS